MNPYVKQSDRNFYLNDLISLSEAAEISGLTLGHLRHLVTTKTIWGKKIGRNWITTKSQIFKYIQQYHPRGRKPKSLD